MTRNRFRVWLAFAFVLLASPIAALAQAGAQAAAARQTGVSGIWLLANLTYAGMRAQSSPNFLGRVLAFFFGLPGTLLTWLVVDEGSERAYGVELPRRRSSLD